MNLIRITFDYDDGLTVIRSGESLKGWIAEQEMLQKIAQDAIAKAQQPTFPGGEGEPQGPLSLADALKRKNEGAP